MVDDEPEEPADAPTKICRACSVQSQTTGAFCPHCGKPYRKRGISRRTKKIAIGVAAVVLIGGATTGISLKVNHNHALQAKAVAAKQEAAAQARVAADAQAAAQKRADAKRAADRAKRKVRHVLVREMQKSITKDATKDVQNGLLDGPILYTSCDPLGGGSTDDLTALTTTFQCIVVNKKNNDGTVSGYNFSATANWSNFSYSWRLGS